MSGGEIWANMTVKEIVSTDAFLNLGAEHQCLYFHLYHNSEYGFVYNAKAIVRMLGFNWRTFNHLIKIGLIERIEDTLYLVQYLNNTDDDTLLRGNM